MRWPGRALGLAGLLIVGAARAEADALASVRAALLQFGGKAPISGVLERAVTSERKERPLEAGRATLDVSAGPAGISIGYPAAVLEQLRVEAADTDPEKPKPVRRTLQDFDAIEAGNMLNGAPALLNDLDGATLRSESATTYGDRPARLLELDLVLRVSKADQKWVKTARRTMKLWVDADGVPLAAESESEYVVGLLIFTFDARESRSQAFTRVGDRLATLRRSTRFDGEGLGESTHFVTDTTLRVKNGG